MNFVSKACSWAFRSRMLVFIYLFVLCAKTIISCRAGCQAKNQKAPQLSSHPTSLCLQAVRSEAFEL